MAAVSGSRATATAATRTARRQRPQASGSRSTSVGGTSGAPRCCNRCCCCCYQCAASRDRNTSTMPLEGPQRSHTDSREGWSVGGSTHEQSRAREREALEEEGEEQERRKKEGERRRAAEEEHCANAHHSNQRRRPLCSCGTSVAHVRPPIQRQIFSRRFRAPAVLLILSSRYSIVDILLLIFYC